MHPAPSLLEAPPKQTDDARPTQQVTMSPASASQNLPHPSPSPPLRKDTGSSTSTSATNSNSSTVTAASGDTSSNTTFSTTIERPPYSNQPIFSINREGDHGVIQRRGSRRRTGPLTADQREKAALIRKIGACQDCKKRRVACQLSHHNMTWDEAQKKFKARSPPQELTHIDMRPLSPAQLLGHRPSFSHDPQAMELDPISDTAPSTGRLPLNEPRVRNRTPLPSGRNLVGLASAALPGIDSIKVDGVRADLQAALSSTPLSRNRYSSASALLLCWEGDNDEKVVHAVGALADTLQHHFNYRADIDRIPRTESYYWLQKRISDFVRTEGRDALKIIYYNGHSFLDEDRQMLIANPDSSSIPSSTVRWHHIQSMLEEASADTLLIMDAAYFPCSTISRKHGVLELIAASASQDHATVLGRTAFTYALIDQLQRRAGQRFKNPITAAELHSQLLAGYRELRDPSLNQQRLLSFPSPLYLQISGNTQLPSIQLSPCNSRRGSIQLPLPDPAAPRVVVSFQVDLDTSVSRDSWAEWLRQMPEGVRDIRVEDQYSNTPYVR